MTPEMRDHYIEIAMAYLTGQAEESQIAEFEKLLTSSPDFQQIVAELEVWLSPLNDDVEPVAPPEHVLEGIMAEILKVQANDNELPKPKSKAGLNYWKYGAIAASIIAALSIGTHFIPSAEEPESTSQLVALMSGSPETPLVAIIYNPENRRVVARLSNVTIPEDSDLELWLIRDGVDGPVSLGILDTVETSDRLEFDLSLGLRGTSDTLALSLEPKGGSGTLKGPQGPILYSGLVNQM